MKLSTKGRYGVRALLDLALHQDEGLVQLKEIARRQEFSLQYLESSSVRWFKFLRALLPWWTVSIILQYAPVLRLASPGISGSR
jgi:hypothetical protein